MRYSYLYQICLVIHLKDTKYITITNAFQKYQTNLDANQTKYEQIKAANFTIGPLNLG